MARIELMLAPWSDDATRLEIRPVARRPQHWNGRRLRRYFDLAHEGADAFLVLANEGCGALAQLPALSAR